MENSKIPSEADFVIRKDRWKKKKKKEKKLVVGM